MCNCNCKCIGSIGQARANSAMTLMATCHSLQRLVYFQVVSVKAW